VIDQALQMMGFQIDRAEYFHIFGDTLRVTTSPDGEFVYVAASKEPAAVATHLACTAPACAEFGTRRCGGCKLVKYCGIDCQRRDWIAHKTSCHAPLAEAAQ